MDYVVIGKVIATFGVKGELKITPYAPEEVFENLKRVYLKRAGGSYTPFSVERVRKSDRFYIIKLRGYDTLEEVLQFQGASVFLPQEELPARGEGEFYAYELVGMEVVGDRGRVIGRVKRIEDLGVYDMLILEDERVMIPFVGDIVLRVDRRSRRITVREDLLPL